MDQITPVPAQAIHLRNPRRSTPSLFVSLTMKSDIVVSVLFDRTGSAGGPPVIRSIPGEARNYSGAMRRGAGLVNRKTENRKQEAEFRSRGIRARARIPGTGPDLPNFTIPDRLNFILH